MRAIVYTETGGHDVLKLVDRPDPTPGRDEVLVRVAVSGVNPTDWKARRGDGPGRPLAFPEVVPNMDGAGTVEAVGADVDAGRVGERVWLWEAARHRANGSAQELVALPASHAVPLSEGASFDLGASIGIPALTAHRCLTVGVDGPAGLGPHTLDGHTVLVAGGAGAVGHAAIELAVWSGATVITTVSTPEKAALAWAAGAQHVVNYREPGAVEAVRAAAPEGVEIIVEVAPATNAALNEAVIARNGTVAIYASERDDLTIAIDPAMTTNTRFQIVLVYTMPAKAKEQAIADVQDAVGAGALRVGAEAGLPLHRFPLERTAEAHAAVEANAVGKVLIDIE
ncbi:MAG: NADPH:quinone reductase [Actinobacteria bacterium]|nr:MAG: NADPH:quinone reductase [Actinomycetota bacterium]